MKYTSCCILLDTTFYDIKILMKELNVVSYRFFMEFVAKGNDNIRTPCV